MACAARGRHAEGRDRQEGGIGIMDRRQFLATSGMTVMAAAFRDLPLLGWQGPRLRSRTCGGRGHLQRPGRHHRVARQRGRDPDRRQPERRRGGGLHRGHRGAGRRTPSTSWSTRITTATMSAATRRSGRWSAPSSPTRTAPCGSVGTAEQAGNEDSQAYPDETFADEWRTTIGDETVVARYHGAGHNERRLRGDLRAGQRGAHGRPDVQSPAPVRRPVLRRADLRAG